MKNAATEFDMTNIRWMGYHTGLKKFFDNTAKLPNLPKGEKNVNVIYSSPSSAFTKYVVPMVNGKTQYPVVSFSLASEETLDEVGNVFKTYKLYQKEKDGSYTSYSFSQPLIKRLNYKCNIFATKMTDCDYLMTMLECSCNKFKPYSCVVNGRPAQFYLDNVEPSNQVEYEGKKFIKCSFDVYVARAMILPVEIERDEAVIKKITTYLSGETDVME